jgi:hypothetical protein
VPAGSWPPDTSWPSSLTDENVTTGSAPATASGFWPVCRISRTRDRSSPASTAGSDASWASAARVSIQAGRPPGVRAAGVKARDGADPG